VDAAVEAASFDAPGLRTRYSEPEDSGFDLESADLSMASTVPEVSVTPAAMSFPEVPARPPQTVPVAVGPRAPAPSSAQDPLADFDPGLDPVPVGEGTETVLVQSFDEPLAEDTATVVEDVDPVRVQSPSDSDATAPVARPGPAPSGVSPALQQHVHATLEKIAWEAFSDLSEQVVKQALARIEAIMLAGRTRLRPILITSVSTIIGLIPMAIGIGEGAEIRRPMAITVIAGNLVATFLTLVVIPVLYAVLDRKEFVKRAVAEAAPLTTPMVPPLALRNRED